MSVRHQRRHDSAAGGRRQLVLRPAPPGRDRARSRHLHAGRRCPRHGHPTRLLTRRGRAGESDPGRERHRVRRCLTVGVTTKVSSAGLSAPFNVKCACTPMLSGVPAAHAVSSVKLPPPVVETGVGSGRVHEGVRVAVVGSLDERADGWRHLDVRQGDDCFAAGGHGVRGARAVPSTATIRTARFRPGAVEPVPPGG